MQEHPAGRFEKDGTISTSPLNSIYQLMARVFHYIRRALESRTDIDTYKNIVRYYPVSQSSITKFYNDTHIFFVLSTGRTGTTWLSDILDTCPSAKVEHEPIAREQIEQVRASQSYSVARTYINDFRLKEIFLRAGNLSSIDVYGETNSALRRHLVPLKEAIPTATLIHLVRDGRDVVRSVYSRGSYAESHPLYRDYMPPYAPFDQLEWLQLTEFERTCWAWRMENEFLRNHISRRARFEDILSSYELFKEQLLNPLELDVDRTTWTESIQKSRNSTSKYRIPEWKEWSQEMKDMFGRICSKEMGEYGYQSE